jgi:hypothetical protein
MGLCSLVCCSVISSLLRRSDCVYICSYGSRRYGLLTCFRRVIVSLIFPYSCLQFSMCGAWEDRGSLFFI